jgi:hypothetical protein
VGAVIRRASAAGVRVASAAIIWHVAAGEAACAAAAARAAARDGAIVANGAGVRLRLRATPQNARAAPQGRPDDAAGTEIMRRHRPTRACFVRRARSRARARGGVAWRRRARDFLMKPNPRGRRHRRASFGGVRVASAAITLHPPTSRRLARRGVARTASRGGATVACAASAREKMRATPLIARPTPRWVRVLSAVH